MPVRARTLTAFMLLVFTRPAAGQDTTSIAIAPIPDSVAWRAGKEDGHSSANEAIVAHRGLIGFVLGLPIGVYALPAAFTLNPVLLAGEGVGVASIIGVGRAGNADVPEQLAARAGTRGAEYERGMREGYAERLRSRRMRAAVGGATAGIVTGAGLLVWALLHSD